MRKFRYTGLTILAIVALAITSISYAKPPKMQTVTTHKFVEDAAKGGMAEVQLGQLAVQKASSPDVKNFGQRMIDDHSKANNELKDLASRKSMTIPTAVDPKDKATMDRLSKLSGKAFDRAYMDDMVKDHEKDVAEFRNEASNGKDADIKSWASKTLPTLEDHLKMAKTTYAKLSPAKKMRRTRKSK
ncbi:MAG TPA: DUF4142 domain-containing protein [Blastocatellia bacterium]|nr:DUF4142 domain-containing protein [Blastocatellia bacterium]